MSEMINECKSLFLFPKTDEQAKGYTMLLRCQSVTTHGHGVGIELWEMVALYIASTEYKLDDYVSRAMKCKTHP